MGEEQSRTWWTADMHLGHRRIIELAHRPFGSLDEMNETIIQRWNAVVSDVDTVWVLGDVAMGPIDESLAMCARLKGRKVLVCGNHDRAWSGYYGKREKQAAWVERYRVDGGFAEILDSVATVDLPGLSTPVSVCHFPYEGDSHGEDRYVEYRPVDNGDWLIHGHVHDSWQVRGRQINVGVDVWDFTPVATQALAELIRTG